MRILDDPEENHGFQDFHEIPWTFMKTIEILEGDHGFQKISMKIRKINEFRDFRVIPQPRARGNSGNSMKFPWNFYGNYGNHGNPRTSWEFLIFIKYHGIP